MNAKRLKDLRRHLRTVDRYDSERYAAHTVTLADGNVREIERAMRLEGETTSGKSVQEAIVYAECVVSKKMPKRPSHIYSVALQQLRGLHVDRKALRAAVGYVDRFERKAK